MKKYNRETLTMCVLEDDRKLSDYAGNQLEEIEYEIPDICMSVKRIPDTTIMKLYHSTDKKLVRKAKELAITYHINHIYDIIHRYFYQFEYSYFEDMFQYGAIGILKSLEHYDGSASLRTYSRFYVVHEISDFTYFIRNISSVHYARQQRQISDAIQEEEFLTDQEIAEKTGLRMEKVRKERQVMERARLVYLDSEEKSDTLAASGNLEDSVTDKIIAEQIIDYINNMPEKKRILLKMRIFEGASYREIADRLGISATCAFDWYHSCIEQIREEFSFEKSSK